MAVSVTVYDHSQEVLDALEEQVTAALDAVGNHAVSYAKTNVTGAGRRRTGNLVNSISHLVEESEKTLYVGTNVSYAIYNEMGTGIYAEGGAGRKTPWRYQDDRGNWHTTRGMAPVHFLKNAIANHLDEYNAIIKSILKK